MLTSQLYHLSENAFRFGDFYFSLKVVKILTLSCFHPRNGKKGPRTSRAAVKMK